MYVFNKAGFAILYVSSWTEQIKTWKLLAVFSIARNVHYDKNVLAGVEKWSDFNRWWKKKNVASQYRCIWIGCII